MIYATQPYKFCHCLSIMSGQTNHHAVKTHRPEILVPATVLCTHPIALNDAEFNRNTGSILASGTNRVVLLYPGAHLPEGLKQHDPKIVESELGFYHEDLIKNWDGPICGIGTQFGRCMFNTYRSLLAEFGKSKAELMTYYTIPSAVIVNASLHKRTFTKGIGAGEDGRCTPIEEPLRPDILQALLHETGYTQDPRHIGDLLIRLDRAADLRHVPDSDRLPSVFSEYLRVAESFTDAGKQFRVEAYVKDNQYVLSIRKQ